MAATESAIWQWTDLAARTHDAVFSLVSEHPELAEELKELVGHATILRRLAEDELRRMARSAGAPVQSTASAFLPWRSSPANLGLRQTVADTAPDAGSRFAVRGDALHDEAAGPGGSKVSVSLDDYGRIAHAFATLCAAGEGAMPGAVQVKTVREATGRAAMVAPCEPRTVSLTHVYVCVRFWTESDLLKRETGGWFRPRMSARNFVSAAAKLWRDRTVEADDSA